MSRSLYVFSVLLASALFITGCSKSPSVEENTKLIEYEMCLETELQKWILQGRNENWSESTLKWLENGWKKEGRVLADYFLEDCQKFHP
jgi:hypothetical protein